MVNYGDGFCMFWNASLEFNILLTSDSNLVCQTTSPLLFNEKVILCCMYIPPTILIKLKLGTRRKIG